MRLPLILSGAVLIATAATAHQTTVASTSAKADKQICKRYAETGSIIPAKKECHTRAEWDRMARDNRADAQAAADRRLGSSPSGS